MNDFLQWKNWWDEKYRFQLGEGVRWASFKTALNLLHQRGGNNIVETGTVRMKDDWGGGMSTLVLGDYAQHYGKKLWTCDISEENINLCKEITQEFSSAITYVINDSINFLITFPEKIDLLYLDSMDCPEFDEPTSPNLIASQQHQLKELEAILDKTREEDYPIILLDDNNFSNGGKCRLSINRLLSTNAWECLFNDKQSLWIPR